MALECLIKKKIKKSVSTGHIAHVVEEKQCPSGEFREGSPLDKIHFLQASILGNTLC